MKRIWKNSGEFGSIRNDLPEIRENKEKSERNTKEYRRIRLNFEMFGQNPKEFERIRENLTKFREDRREFMKIQKISKKSERVRENSR